MRKIKKIARSSGGYIAKVLIEPKLHDQLTGKSFLTPRLLPFWAIYEHDDGVLYLWHEAGAPLGCQVSILPEAKCLAIEISKVMCRLYADARQTRWLLSQDQKGRLIESETKLVPMKPLQGQRGQRKLKDEIGTRYNIDLSNGLVLSIWNPASEIRAKHVSWFLADAIDYLKSKREALGVGSAYDGLSFTVPLTNRNTQIGWIGLWRPTEENVAVLNLDQYCNAVFEAYSVASTIENFQADLALFLEQNDSPELQPILDALVAENDGIRAFQLLIDQRRTKLEEARD